MNLLVEAWLAIESVFTSVTIAALIVFFGLVIGKLFGRMLYYLTHELGIDSVIKWGFGFELPVALLISTTFEFAVYILSFIFALYVLQLSTVVVSAIAGLVGIIVVVYMLLGLKDFVSNLLATIVIMRTKGFAIGAQLQVREHNGMIESISLTETRLLLENDDVVSIPNALFVREPYTLQQ